MPLLGWRSGVWLRVILHFLFALAVNGSTGESHLSGTGKQVSRNATKTVSIKTGSGYAYAESCQAELRAWSSSSSSHGRANGHESTSYFSSSMTIHSVSGGQAKATSWVTLCDRHPRAVGQVSYAEERTSTYVTFWTNTNPTFVFASYPTPKPCTISEEDCTLLYSSWTSHWNAITNHHHQGLLDPPCTTSTRSLHYSTDSAGHVCDNCLVLGHKIRLLYWPVTTEYGIGNLCSETPSTISASPTGSGPNTFVTGGMTITSPTVAVSIGGLSRVDKCGTTVAETIIPVLPEDVTSVEGGRALFEHRSFNFANLNYRCMDDPETIFLKTSTRTDCYQEVPASAYFNGYANWNQGKFWLPDPFANLTIWANYQPQVLPPNTLNQTIKSLWGPDCYIHPDGVWDPPIALGHETKIPLPHAPNAPPAYTTESYGEGPAPTYAMPSVTHASPAEETTAKHDPTGDVSSNTNGYMDHNPTEHTRPGSTGHPDHDATDNFAPAATHTSGHQANDEGHAAGHNTVHIVHTTLLTFPAKHGVEVFTAMYGAEGTTLVNAESTIRLTAGSAGSDVSPVSVDSAQVSADPASADPASLDPEQSSPTHKQVFTVDGSEYTVDPMGKGGFELRGASTTVSVKDDHTHPTKSAHKGDKSAHNDASKLTATGSTESVGHLALGTGTPSPSATDKGDLSNSHENPPTLANASESNEEMRRALMTCARLSVLAVGVAIFL